MTDIDTSPEMAEWLAGQLDNSNVPHIAATLRALSARLTEMEAARDDYCVKWSDVSRAYASLSGKLEASEAERDDLDRKWTTAVQLTAHALNTEGDPGEIIDDLTARLEATEAERDAWKANAEALAEFVGEFDAGDNDVGCGGRDCRANVLIAAHAKLKGGA